jgi:hypothetical protein
MLADRETRLAAADDYGIDPFRLTCAAHPVPRCEWKVTLGRDSIAAAARGRIGRINQAGRAERMGNSM